jgi:hypothetical protein
MRLAQAADLCYQPESERVTLHCDGHPKGELTDYGKRILSVA